MDKKIKFAIVGQGHIGKRHAEMVRRNGEAQLMAVCDTAPKEKLGLENLDVPFYSSIEEMLAAGHEIDVVSVCTPNGLHAKHSLLALENKMHVVCEKPMALHKADCESLIYKALQMHKNLFCVMQNRYSPPSVWIKEIIENKTIGEVFLVQLNCYWNRDDRYYKAGHWKGNNEFIECSLPIGFLVFIRHRSYNSISKQNFTKLQLTYPGNLVEEVSLKMMP